MAQSDFPLIDGPIMSFRGWMVAEMANENRLEFWAHGVCIMALQSEADIGALEAAKDALNRLNITNILTA